MATTRARRTRRKGADYSYIERDRTIYVTAQEYLKWAEDNLVQKNFDFEKLTQNNIKELLSKITIEKSQPSRFFHSYFKNSIITPIKGYGYVLYGKKGHSDNQIIKGYPRIVFFCYVQTANGRKSIELFFLDSLFSWFYIYDSEGRPVIKDGEMCIVSGKGNALWERCRECKNLWELLNLLLLPNGKFRSFEVKEVIHRMAPRYVNDVIVGNNGASITLFDFYKGGSVIKDNYDICIDGVYYQLDLDEMVAHVVMGGDSFNNNFSYEGFLNIPSEITFNGRTLPVVSIPSFRGNNKLTSIQISADIKTIEESCFLDCRNLKEVMLGNSIKSIGANAFSGCTSLETIKNIELLDNIGNSAFSGCNSLEYIHLTNVFNIESMAFSGCCELKEIWLGDNLKSIADSAFINCGKLKEIRLGDNLKFIGDYAFSGCSSLKTIVIPNSCDKLGRWVFQDCVNLERCILSKKLTELSDYLFENCIVLKDIELPESIVSIGCSTFEGCSSLKYIKLNEGLRRIGNSSYDTIYENSGAFAGCESLRELNIPSTVTEIGAYSFKDCRNLHNIQLPETIEDIGICAFNNCTSLTEFTVPHKVIKLGNFRSNSELKRLGLAYDVDNSFMSAFAGCVNLKTIFFSKSRLILYMQNHKIFEDCPVASFYLGRNIEGMDVIDFEALRVLTIGQYVNKLPKCFSKCEYIEKVYSHIMDPTTLVPTFTRNVYINATLYVPKGCRDKYLSTLGWKSFFNIQETLCNYSAPHDMTSRLTVVLQQGKL